MAAKITIITLLAAAAAAIPQYGPPPPSYHPAPRPSYHPAPRPSYHQPTYPDTPPKYAFDYAVQDAYSGASYSQQEKRDGYDTQGSYYVALPDGRTQKVTYYVNGDSGYVAKVEYEGQAKFPQHGKGGYHPPQPSYGPAPKPSYG